MINELRHRNPLAPLSIFRINGLGFSNLTQLTAIAGFLAMFFFLTLYMQNVLHYSPIQTGLAYLPLCFAIGISAGISSQLLSRVGTRPVIVAGALIAAAGMYWLSRIPVHGTYLHDLLPGMLVLVARLRPGVRRRHHRRQRRRPCRQGRSRRLAAERLAAARRRARAGDLHRARHQPHQPPAGRAHAPAAHALTAGFERALLVGSIFILAAAVIALRATNTRGEAAPAEVDAVAGREREAARPDGQPLPAARAA